MPVGGYVPRAALCRCEWSEMPTKEDVPIFLELIALMFHTRRPRFGLQRLLNLGDIGLQVLRRCLGIRMSCLTGASTLGIAGPCSWTRSQRRRCVMWLALGGEHALGTSSATVLAGFWKSTTLGIGDSSILKRIYIYIEMSIVRGAAPSGEGEPVAYTPGARRVQCGAW